MVMTNGAGCLIGFNNNKNKKYKKTERFGSILCCLCIKKNSLDDFLLVS